MNYIIGKTGFLTQALLHYKPDSFKSNHCFSFRSNHDSLIDKLINDPSPTLLFAAWPTNLPYDDIGHIDFWLYNVQPFLVKVVSLIPNIRLITFGTCLEYGLYEGGLHEHLLCAPCTKLGTAKLMMLAKCLEFKLKYYFHLRIFYPYSFQKPRSNTFLYYLKQAVDSNLESFEMSKGTQMRDFFDLDYFSNKISRVLQLSSEEFNIANIGTGMPISCITLAHQYLAYRGYKLRLDLGKVPVPWYEPDNFYSNSLLHKL